MKLRTKASIGLAIGLVLMTGTQAWAANTWTLMTTKNPGAEWDSLFGVTAVSSTNVWAVGQYVQSPGGTNGSLIEHYDGSTWSVAYKDTTSELQGVKATSASNIWAVGLNGSGPAILRYDGSTWSTQTSPSVPEGSLYGVGASSKNDAWAAGYQQIGSTTKLLIEHWNGTAWKLVHLTDPGTTLNDLYGVSSPSPTDVWAVGYYADSLGGASKALVLHYDGTHWFRFSALNPGSCGATLDSVSATSATDVWASGSYCPSSGTRGLVEHYDGTSWTAYGFINPSQLLGVKATSPSNVWAVGQSTDGSAFATHWDGSGWTRQTTPATASGSDSLDAVAASSSTTAFAVGESIYNAQKIRTLAMRCCT